jgi:hypothetical protein
VTALLCSFLAASRRRSLIYLAAAERRVENPDVGPEEFDETHAGTFAGGGDEDRGRSGVKGG